MNKSNFQIISIYKNFASAEDLLVEMRRMGAERSIFTSIKNINSIEKSILKKDMNYLRRVSENTSF
jgi:hypothetical protein